MNIVAGHYEIIRELGRGGMGVVHLAVDNRIGRQVAIKELAMSGLVQDADTVIARFQREAQAASKLQHPNIVSVFEYCHDGMRHFMVMEFLEGKSLQHYIDQRQPFTVEQVVDIGAQICAALDYAHVHQIVHRDIKPDNVILLDNGRVKLMDFGVARHMGEVSKLTQTGSTLGTIAYISPEQLCDSRLVDGRSDLFSLGVMLYEMLTLRTPFDAGNVGGTIMKIMGEDPVPPRQMNPAIPARLESVIMRALRKNPDERFARAADMGQALVASIRQAAPTEPRTVQLNMLTCRGCGTPMPGGKGPCPKCGRLQAPAAPETTSAIGLSARSAPPPPPAPAPRVGNTGGLAAPAPRPAAPAAPMESAPAARTGVGTGSLGTGSLAPGAQARPGFPPRPGTGALGRATRSVVGARFLYSFGTPGGNAGQFQQPRGLLLDAKNHLYVADTENGRVQVFDTQGRPLREIRPAKGREGFRFPRALALSPSSGNLYIIDEMDFRIYVHDPAGKQIQVWDRRRNPSEPSVIPGRLTISPNGNVFVSEPNTHRVMVYAPSHMFNGAIGAGELQSPGGVALGRGVLYVLDAGLCRVQAFDLKGKPQLTFGRRGTGPGEFSLPRDMIVDRAGNVLVADTLNHRVQMFSPQGDLTHALGLKGKGEGEFAGPEGIALSNDDQLFVSDRGNSRVQVFQLERG